jgi:hypothetical protein
MQEFRVDCCTNLNVLAGKASRESRVESSPCQPEEEGSAGRLETVLKLKVV